MVENTKLTEINPANYNYKKVAYTLFNKVNANISDIKEWGELQYTTDIKTKAIAEKNQWTIDIEILDKVVYGAGFEFPSKDIKDKIAREIEYAQEIVDVDNIKNLLFDKEFNVFAWKITGGDYHYIESEDNIKKWKPLTFTSLSMMIAEVQGVDFYWKVNNLLMKASNHTPYDWGKALACIVLGDYCDRYVPNTKDNKEGLTKVTFEGFCSIFAFLNKAITSEYISTTSMRGYYNQFDKNNLLTFIPQKWHDKDIEFLKTDALFGVIDLIWANPKEKEETNSDDDKEEESKKSSADICILTSSEQLIQTAKDFVEQELIKYDGGDAREYNKGSREKLSNLLNEQYLILHSDIWVEEVVVDIDTGITERGMALTEDQMLFALCSYGNLEILVEDDVVVDLDELEKAVEQKYGISCAFFPTNKSEGKFLLERGKEL